MSNSDYIFAVARIRAREKWLLSDADVRQMIAMKSEGEVLTFLADKGWGTPDTAQDADSMLEAEEKKNHRILRELKVPKAVHDVLSLPQYYHNLKAGIKEICTSEDFEGVFYDLEDFSKKDVVKILQEKTFYRLPEHMQSTAKEAYEIMLQTMDGQRCDIIVDRGCLEAMIIAGRASGDAMLKSYAESNAVTTDIKIAARAARTGKSVHFLKEALAPCAGLDVKALGEAAARSEEGLLSYLEGHGFREGAEALKKSPSAFEKWCDNRLMANLKLQKRNTDSAGPVAAYYLARQNEIKMTRIILTAKANGFTEEDIRERVRDMYV